MPVTAVLHRASRPLFVSLALLAHEPRASASGPDTVDVVRRLVALPEEAKNDQAALFDRYLAVLEETKGSPLVELALRRLAEIEDSGRRIDVREKTYEDILRGGTGNPYTEDLLRGALADIRERRGDRDAATRLRRAERFLTRWQVIGPFGCARAELHDWAFPPENEIDFTKKVPGFSEEVGWRRLEPREGEAAVSPFEALFPWDGCAYALDQLHSPTPRDAFLEFRPAGSAKVFLNGVVVIDADRSREDLLNTIRAPIRLEHGWNRLLVKTTSPGEGRFSARLLGLDGSPIEDVREERDAVVRRPAAGASGRPAMRAVFPDARALLERAVSERQDDPHLLAAYAWILNQEGLAERGLQVLARAAELESGSPLFLSYYASALHAARHLPATYRAQKARDLFEQARAKDADFFPALLWLASFMEGDDRIDEAVAILRHASEVAPKSTLPHLLLAGYFQKQNWQVERLAELEAARRLGPAQPRVLNDLAVYWLGAGNSDRAIELYEESLRSDARQDEVKRTLITLYRDRGDDTRALALFRTLRRQDRGRDLDVAEGLASFQRDRGQIDAAIQTYLDVAKRYPRYSTFKKSIADLYLEKGDAETARSWYRRALDVDPGFHQVREILRRLEGGEDPEFKAYEVDARALLKDAPGASLFPRATSLAVLDDLVLRLYEDGSNRRITHQLFKIQNDQGVEKYKEFRPGEELLDLNVIRPDGAVLEPVTLPAEAGLTLPGLAIGAAVEWRYADEDRWPPGFPVNIPTFYFQDLDLDEPFLWSRYVVIEPKSLAMKHRVHRFPGVPAVRDLADGATRVTIYQVRNLDIVKKEPYMPDPREIVPQVTLTQALDWKELNQIYKRDEAFRVTPEIERAAAEATAGLTGDFAKSERLYRFVNDTVRDPRGSSNPTAVLIERKGSRLALYRALLRAADIATEDARCRLAPGLDVEDPEWDWIRESLYPSPLLRVLPRDHEPIWVWLEVRELPFGRLPFYLNEAPVFIFDGGEGRRDRLPRTPDEELLAADSSAEVRPEESGYAVDVNLRIPAFVGYPMKEGFRTMEVERRKLAGTSVVSQMFPGSTMRTIDFPGLEEPEAPMSLHVAAGLKNLVDKRGGELTCRTGIEPLKLTARFSSGDRRAWPVVYRDFDHRKSRVSFDLGGRYRVLRLPKAIDLDAFLGRYRLSAKEENGRVVVEREVSFDPHRIPVEQYPALLAWCRQIDDLEAERIVLEEPK